VNGSSADTPAGQTRADAILAAVTTEIERWRHVINHDPGLQSVVITVHLAAGFGHPRSVECGIRSEQRLAQTANRA